MASGLNLQLTPDVVQLLVNVGLIVAMVHVILGGCAYAIMLERKLSAWMQDRLGPNRVGPLGLLQPIADGIKFMVKEDYNPKGVDKALFFLAPGYWWLLHLRLFHNWPLNNFLQVLFIALVLLSFGAAALWVAWVLNGNNWDLPNKRK